MRILMCPPTHYDVVYEINPWMDTANKPDPKKSYDQWKSLFYLYQSLDVEVELIDQVDGLPDMVFTANGGTVYKNMFVSGNYHFKERKGEEKYFQKWFQDHNFNVQTHSHFQGGEGDALFYRDTFYLGYGFRSAIEAHEEMKNLLGVNTVSIQLIDPYFYDFDTTFCPVGDRGVLYFPDAYDTEGQELMRSVPNAVPMTKEQAQHFVGNSVYVNGKLLVSFLDDDLKKKLAQWDVQPILLDMSEFKKAGGGIKCLTLYIEK